MATAAPQNEIELIPTNLSPEAQEEQRNKTLGDVWQDDAFLPQTLPENTVVSPTQTPIYAPQEAVSGSLNTSEAVKATTVSSGNGNKGWAILGGALLLGGIGAAAAGGGGGKKSADKNDNTDKPNPTPPSEPTLSAPEIRVDKVANIAQNQQNQTLTLSGSLKSDPNAVKTDVFVSVNGGAAQAAKVSGDKWTLDISGSDLAQKQGENALAISAVSHDKNGKTVYANNVLANYFVDTHIATPKVTLNDIADKLTTEAQPITLSGSLNGVDADASSVVRVQINNGEMKTAKVSGNTWTLDVPASEMVGKLGANRVDVTAIATDKFGNTAQHSASDDFHVYTPIVVPTVSFGSKIQINQANQKQNFTLSGSLKSDPNAVKTDVFVIINGKQHQAKISGETWTLGVSGSELAQKQGNQTLEVKAISTDRFQQNVPSQTVSGSYAVDTKIATPKVTLNDIADKLTTETQPITLSGSLNGVDADASAVVRIQINNGEMKTAKVSGNTWTLDVPASEMVGKLGANRVDVSAIATDKFGNSARHAASDVYDVIAPTETQIFYASGKMDSVSGSTAQAFDGKGLSDKGKIFDNEEKILAAYAQFHDKIDVSKPTYPFGSIGIGAVLGGVLGNIPKDYNKVTTPTIEKNIEKAYATDRDKDGVIDAFDHNPNTWDVSERDLRFFATISYETPENLEKVFKLNDTTAIQTMNHKDNFDNAADISELIQDWDLLEAKGLSSGLDYAVFGNGKKMNGAYENVVVAFRGTKGITDIISDIGVGVGKLIDEVQYFDTLAENVMSKYKPSHVYTTGHSLGGYLAQYFASHTMQQNAERKAVFERSAIFNPAKLTNNDNGVVDKANEMHKTMWGWVDDPRRNPDAAEIYKSMSYVIDGDVVAYGDVPTEYLAKGVGLTAAGVALSSVPGIGWLFGGLALLAGVATAAGTGFDGLGTYDNAVEFTGFSGNSVDKHSKNNFYKDNKSLKDYFSHGYRMDKHYLSYDADNDGLTDYQEKRIGTDFRTSTKLNGKDTDQDGFSDHLEIKLGSDWQNADDIVEVSSFVAQSEWDSPILAVAATHTSDAAKTFLGATGYLLSPTAKGNDLSYTPNGETVDLSVLTQQDWDDWLYSGSHLHNGTNGNDDLTGASSLNNATRLLYGGAGDDTVHGSDVLAIMIGGAGEDTFKFKASNLISDWTTVIGNGHNIVVDFEQGDKLDFSASRELFSDRNANFKWSDVLGETAAAFQNQSALIWQDNSKTLAYKSSQSHDLHAFARFDDSQTFASIQAGLIG